jgi:hypothetical protein
MWGVSGKVDDEAEMVECGIERDSSSNGIESTGSDALRTCDVVRSVVGASELLGSETFLACRDPVDGFLSRFGIVGARDGGVGKGKFETTSRSSISMMLFRLESTRMSSNPSPTSGSTRRRSKSVVVSRVNAGEYTSPTFSATSQYRSDDFLWGGILERPACRHAWFVLSGVRDRGER